MRRNMFARRLRCRRRRGGPRRLHRDDTPPSASPTSTGRSSSSRTAATSSTPTPTRSLTPEEQDLRSAEEAITEYWKVIDEAASNPNQNLKVLATVARSQALAQWQTTLTTDRAKGLSRRGCPWSGMRGRDQGRQDVHGERLLGRLGSGRRRRCWQVSGAVRQASHTGLHLHGAEGARGVLRHRGPAQGSVMRRLIVAASQLGVRGRDTSPLAIAAPPVACPPGQEPHPKTGACIIVLIPPPSPGITG